MGSVSEISFKARGCRLVADFERPVVAGSTSGIGVAIARRLVQEGCAVVVHSHHSIETGRALASAIGHAAYDIQADPGDGDLSAQCSI
jgi:NAD(P)-dependent dehydrogenase (short-subunit alcohol dehydrogenase family)